MYIVLFAFFYAAVALCTATCFRADPNFSADPVSDDFNPNDSDSLNLNEFDLNEFDLNEFDLNEFDLNYSGWNDFGFKK